MILLSRLLSGLLLDEAYFEAWRYMPTLLCAAAVESVVAFLATVYLVQKKSMHSFVTAVVGTTVNLLLNAILIPRMGWYGGPLGAAIATLLGYVAVYLLRTADVRRLLKFRMYLPKQTLNFLLLIAMAAVMTFMGQGRFLTALLIGAFVIALNFWDLFSCVRVLLGSRLKK